MKKILSLILSLLISGTAYADLCGTSLMPLFNAQQATGLCKIFGSAINHNMLFNSSTQIGFTIGFSDNTNSTLLVTADTNASAASYTQYQSDSTQGGNLVMGSGITATADVNIGATDDIIFETRAGVDATVIDTVTGNTTMIGTLTSSRTTDFGWTRVNVANQACNTTCTSACVVGIDTAGTGGFLLCTDATADSCICAGAS